MTSGATLYFIQEVLKHLDAIDKSLPHSLDLSEHFAHVRHRGGLGSFGVLGLELRAGQQQVSGIGRLEAAREERCRPPYDADDAA